MLIGVISDTHDNLDNLSKVFSKLKQAKVKAVLHCGDFCAPFMMLEFDKLGLPMHLVFGNIDDRFLANVKANDTKNVTLHGDVAEIELGGKKICLNHYPNIARAFAHTEDYDAVFFGHNHIKSQDIVNNTLLANPGNVAGIKNPPSYGIYNTDDNSFELFDL